MKWRTYPAYRDSGVEWLGDIPEQWQTRRIGHTTYVKGRIGWQGLTSGEFVDEGPYCVTGTDLVNGKVNWDTCYHVTEERYQEDPYIHLKERDLLITKDGTIGKTAIVVDLSAKATLNSGIFLARPTKQAYDTTFMYWILNSQVFNDFIDVTKMGSTIAHLYQNVFVRFSFPLPSPDEQRAISSFLDRETSRIDNLIAKKQRQIELLQEKRSALISHVVTKGLDLDVKMKDSGVEWLGEIPEHWAITPAKRITEVFVPQRNKPELNSDDGIPWITMEDMVSPKVSCLNATRFVTKEAAKDAGSRILPSGSVIVSCVGDFGLASVNSDPVIINQQLQAYIPKNLDANFLQYFIGSSKPYFDSIATTTTIGYVNQERFGQLPVTLPPPFEQLAIVTFLDEKARQIDRLAKKAFESIKVLREYRTALISAAVTGKIDVREEVT